MSRRLADRMDSECPDCGGLKIRSAQRCRSCAGKARRGETRTATPAPSTAWARAQRLRPLVACEYPGCDEMGRDRHHIDGNPQNNTLENIAVYCRRHHMTVDGRLQAAAERAPLIGQLGGRPKERGNAR